MGEGDDMTMNELLEQGRARVASDPRPESVAALEWLEKIAGVINASLAFVYGIAYAEATRLHAEGEEEGMIRSKVLDVSLRDWPDAPLDSLITRPVHDALDDAMAGREARVNPTWDFTRGEMGIMVGQTKPTPEHYEAAKQAGLIDPFPSGPENSGP